MTIKTLLVDDERSLLEQAEIFLERMDEEIEVQTVSSPKKALDAMDEEDFDVIVSDYQMPEMDGLEFLEKIREEREIEIPFIMFTGKGREDVAMNALNLGADRYLQKGGDPKAQYEVLAQAIKQEFEHKGAKEKIVELNSLLRSLSNVNRLIGEEDDLKTLMEKAAVELVETRNYQNMEISLLDRKDGKIKPVASSGVHPEREWEVTTDGSGDAPKCVKEVVRNPSTHLINDPEKYCTDCGYMDENEYHDTLLIPITHRSELTGIISACYKSGHDLSEDEVELLERMGKNLGLAREKIIVENKLEESEEKFKNLTEVTSLPIAIYQDEYWVYANPAAIDICGYSLEELKEMKYWEFVAPEHREMLKKQVLEKEGSESGYEIKIITKDGKKKWVYLTESDIDYKDEPVGLISIIDITDRKKKEGELQKTGEELKKNKKRRKLEDFAVEMESIDDEEKLYRLTVEAAKRILNFGICSLDIVEDGEFEVKASIGDNREKGTRYPIKGLAGKSYKKGESLLIRDIEEEEDAKTKRESYRSAMSVPVEDFGVFMIWSEQKGDFDEKDLELAETLVHHTKLVLDRIKGEEKLRKSEEKYRTIFESANDAIFILKKDRIVDCNEKTLELFGCDRDDIINESPYEFSPEKQPDGRESKEKAMEKINSALEGEPQEFEWVHTTKDDEPFHTKVTLNHYMIDDEKLVIGIVRDISERKEYLEELKRKEKYIDHTPEFINIIDEKGEIKYQSSPSHGVEGIDPSKVMGSKGVEFVHPDDKEEFQEMFSKVLENPGEEYRTELRGETKDGWVWFEVRAINHLDDPEINGIIVTSRDISKRKEMEEELMKSEKKFRNIFENLGDPVIIKKLGGKDHGNILDANRAMSDMLGYSSEEFIEMNVYDDIAVDDPKKLSWDEVKEKLKEGDRTEFTVKKRKKDGSEVWVEVVAVPMEYEGENAALAVNRNVTDRERRKSELQERVKELDCLYTVSNLTQKQDMKVENLLQEVVENIPPGISYPEDTSARITFDGQSYKSESFEESFQSLSKDFSTEYGFGEIEVYVDRKRDSEDVFLEEEKELLNSITVHLENFIERKEIGEHLKRSNSLLNLSQSLAKVGGWEYDVKKDRFTWTDEVYRIYGVDKEGYDPNELNENLSFYSSEDREKIEEAFTNAVENGEPYDLELRFNSANDEQLWVRTVGQPFVEDGKVTKVFGNIMDITERKEANEQINENKNKIERLHEISAELQTYDSEEDIYSLAMEAAEDILDFDICEISVPDDDVMKGLVRSRKLSEEPSSKLNPLPIDDSIAGKTHLENRSFLVEDIHADEQANPTLDKFKSAISVPIGEHGVFQALSTEINHFDEEELEIVELLMSHVSEALKRIQAKEREEFLHSLLRHDVGNKNQIVKGYLELMKDYDLPDKMKDFVDKAERATDDSTEIIEKVRKLREIEEEEEIGEMDLSSVMEKVSSENQAQLQEEGISLNIDDCDGKVKGGALLEELFSNLIENSIQHTDCDEIRISSQIKEDECVVIVEDNGAGISDEKKDKIFDKGYNEGESAGTGLGLYMVKEIAESYGGSVEVKDSELGGARFDIHLEKSKNLNDQGEVNGR